MPLNFQFGYEHYLYLGATGGPPVDTPQALTGRPSETVDYTNWSANEWANIRTLNLGGNTNSINITTRDEARSGFSSEVDVTQTGQMTFEVRYKRLNGATVQDPLFEVALKAWLGKLEFAACDFDQQITVLGTQGLIGNWTATFTNNKEVEGAVLSNMTLKLSSFPNWIRLTATGPDVWTAIG